jgi:hypothetical protein
MNTITKPTKMILFKGKKKGIIHTKNITWEDIRRIFNPRNFHEKYYYLGYVPYEDDGKTFKALYPLVLLMDREAKPWWCPRWFLRFLHLFGDDNSIVRVRNFRLHYLNKRITRGIKIYDYKLKWTEYDLRISIAAPKYLQDLADMIERDFYNQGNENNIA